MLKQLFFTLMYSANAAFAQTNIVSSFSGTQLDQTIFLSFTLEAGQTCNGVIIERSSDSISFAQIGDIPGVCGSSTEPVSYSYTDSFPLNNANNFYRLAPGNFEWSDIIKIYFDANTNAELLIKPNPFYTSAIVKFKNPTGRTVEWLIYNSNGKKVREGNTKEQSFTLLRNNLASGLYILHLAIDNRAIQKTKLIIE